jgi:methyl-accepting chemotaxis protein
MSRLHTGSLKARLMTAFAVVLVITAVDGAVGLWSMRTLDRNVEVIANDADALSALQQTNSSYARMRQQVIAMVVGALDPTVPDALRQEWSDKQQAYDAEVDEHLAVWRDGTTLGTTEVRELEEAIAGHRSVVNDIALPVLTGRTPTIAPPDGAEQWTVAAILTASDGRYGALVDTFAKMIDLEQAHYRTAVEDAHGSFSLGRNLIVLVILGAIGIAVALALRTTRSITRPVEETAVKLQDAAGRLELAAHAVDGEARSTADRASSVAAAATEVGANMETVAAAIEEMRASIGEISHGSQGAARATAEARSRAEAASATVDELGRMASEITAVATMIGDIAEQTNLLALNATIEAARAGEAGRGFAVVASEVKELAQQTAGATESITRNIETIQQRTRAAVVAISEISEVVASVDDLTGQIASAIEEQSATASEIARNVSETSDAVGGIAEAVVQVEASAQTTTSTVGESIQSAVDMRALAGGLQELVDGSGAAAR